MKCADLPRRLFQVLPTVSHRKPPRRSLAFDCLEGKLLLSTYYVATTGSNSASGSATAPWATIQQAANVVAPGDTVYVAPGNYSAAVTTNTSGTAADPIKFISTVPWAQTSRARAAQAVQPGTTEETMLLSRDFRSLEIRRLASMMKRVTRK